MLLQGGPINNYINRIGGKEEKFKEQEESPNIKCLAKQFFQPVNKL